MSGENTTDQRSQNEFAPKKLIKVQNLSQANVNKNIRRKTNKCLKTEDVNTSMRIYIQNISGSKSKTSQINTFLTEAGFDLIFIQETWWNNSITNDVVIQGTEYCLYRSDRDLIRAERDDGGGVAILLKNTIRHEYIIIEDGKLLEHQAILIYLGTKIIAFVNVYFPPIIERRSRCIMVAEIGRTIAALKRKHNIYQLIVLGDFNSPNINWEFDDENPGAMINTSTYIIIYETKLVQLAAQHRLNSNPNQRGACFFLSDNTNWKVLRPIQQELMDRESISHNAVEVILRVNEKNVRSKDRNIFSFSERTKKIQNIMNQAYFVWMSENEEITASNAKIDENIDHITERWRSILRENIVHRCRNLPPDISSHKWSKDAKYVKLFKIKSAAKDEYKVSQSLENKNALAKANIALSTHYKVLKDSYHRKMIQNLKGDAKEFYGVMKNRNSSRSTLPVMMYSNEQQLIGAAILKALALHLESAFAKNDYFDFNTKARLREITFSRIFISRKCFG